MNDIDDLLQQIPFDQIADRLGVNTGEAESLARRAVPALLAGMEANAQDPGGAQSLARALSQHQDGGLDLSSVDTSDGASIVGHIFGDNQDQVVSRLGGSDQGGLMQKLLPMLAPLILSWLAGKVLGGGRQSGGSGGGLGDVLGDVLGGSAQRQPADTGTTSGSGGLGDILGDVLSGGAAGGSGGGLGDILGEMLGKKGGSQTGSGSGYGDLGLDDLLGGGRKA